MTYSLFRSAPPRRGGRCTLNVQHYFCGFDPRPPRRGDARGQERTRGRGVSIRAPAKGRPPPCLGVFALTLFRSAPPRRGDPFHLHRLRGFRVSIRAPAKGRHRKLPQIKSTTSFDPRPREGATCPTTTSCRHRPCFDPRPREGATRCDRRASRVATCFDPRPREGATPQNRVENSDIEVFDPRPRRRGDAAGRCLQHRLPVSIRAPAKGRQASNAHDDLIAQFRSAPPRRGDSSEDAYMARAYGFDPRPREGADRVDPWLIACFGVSIRAPAKGRRPQRVVEVTAALVSIRAPAKGRHTARTPPRSA